jgi:hypothetical protein
MSVLDRLAKQQASLPKRGNFNKVKGIYLEWKEGANILRLVGDFIEVHTHFIAPAPKRKERGLCIPAAFEGEGKLPQVINCPDWDIVLERPKKEKTCPYCKLNAISRTVLKENPTPEQKAFFEHLRGASRASSNLKWNVLDRDNPMVEEEKNGKNEKVLSFKIATVGTEAQGGINKIYKQVGYDINDPDRGIDIDVNKDSSGTRTKYSAGAVLEGISLKVTPLTKEERALTLHDLKVRCGKMVDPEKLKEALHEDLLQILQAGEEEAKIGEADSADGAETNVVDEAAEAAIAEVSESVNPKGKATPPTAGKVPGSVMDRLAKKPVAAAPEASEEALGDGDEDSIPDSGAKKK